jgi:tetratricopeptide (TPR) repeat protein
MASGAQAVTLGAVHSAPYIGRPFYASVPVSDSENTIACVRAQLSYGDMPVGSLQIQQRSNAIVVRSARPVDEPIVTLFISADCDTPISRSYTLFADMPRVSDGSGDGGETPDDFDPSLGAKPNYFGVQSNLDTSSAENISKNPSSAPTKQVKVWGNRDLALAETGVVPPLRKNRTAPPKAAVPLSPSGLTPSSAISQHPGVQTPRLELDNTDWVEQAPRLRLDDALLTAASTDMAVRDEARVRWAALNAQMAGGDAHKDRLRSALATTEQALELQAKIQHNEKEIAQLKAQLSQEKSTGNTRLYLLWGILGSALLAAIAIAFQRWRQHKPAYKNQPEHQKTSWWQQNAPHETPDAPSKQSVRSATSPRLMGYVEELPMPEVDFSADIYSDFAALDAFNPEHQDAPKPSKPVSKGIDGLQNVQEQADFFAALGQFDQAEDLLRRFIEKNPETSLLAYLSLLGIYYTAQRHDAFEALRQHYNNTFNAQVPDFDHFKSDPRGLESYPAAIERIQQAWGSSDAIRQLEDLLFRHPGRAHPDEAFAPLAYRELLLLYGIATDTMATPEDISRIRSVTASAQQWLQPAPLILDPVADAVNLPLEPDVDLGEGHYDGAAAQSTSFQTAPSPLDHDLDRLDDSAAPEHMNLDLELGVLDSVDLALPDDHGISQSGIPSNIIDFDIEDLTPHEKPLDATLADIDFSLDKMPSAPADLAADGAKTP